MLGLFLAVAKTHPISGTGFSFLDFVLAVAAVVAAFFIDKTRSFAVLATVFCVTLLVFALMFKW